MCLGAKTLAPQLNVSLSLSLVLHDCSFSFQLLCVICVHVYVPSYLSLSPPVSSHFILASSLSSLFSISPLIDILATRAYLEYLYARYPEQHKRGENIYEREKEGGGCICIT